MHFGFTKSVLVLAVPLFLMGWLFRSGEMAFTRAAAPVIVMVLVLVPVFIVVDLWKHYQWKRLAHPGSGSMRRKLLPRRLRLGNVIARLLTRQR